MGTGKNGRARRRHPRVSSSRAPTLSFAHYFQAPATQASYLFTTASPYQVFEEQLCSQKPMIWLHQTPVHLHIPNVRVNCAYECWKDPGKEVEVHLLFSGVLCWQGRTTCQLQLQHHFFMAKLSQSYHIQLPLLVDATVEKKTTKNVVEYFPALARCGNFCLVSSYRRRLCAKRHQAGRQASSGLNPYCLLPHWLRSKKSREEKRSYQIVDEMRSRTLGTRLVETPSATGILHMNSLICNSTYSFCTGFEFSLYSFRLFPH